MKFYLAPLEGVTGYVYRNAYHRFFCPADKYFTPFIATSQKMKLKPKEMKDIFPENNQGLTVVPQILTNQAEQFIQLAESLVQLGYQEINLNLGCPSGTVVAKNKGAGFLAHPKELECFLDEIFAKPTAKISIKTRIGKEDKEEFEELLRIYNKYPVEELIIHPRLQTDYYKNKPDLEIFQQAMEASTNPLCYNGDIFTVGKYKELTERFPELGCVMLGRGVISNPGLIGEITGQAPMNKQTLREFYEKLYQDYCQVIQGGERNILFKMKEMWSYMAVMFSDYEKYAKKIRKSESLRNYELIVDSLFREQELVDGAHFGC